MVDRANQLLAELAVSHGSVLPTNAAHNPTDPQATTPGGPQMSLFTEYVDHPAVAELRELDLNALSPMQAFDALRRVREMLGE